jgi:hypothetical protein
MKTAQFAHRVHVRVTFPASLSGNGIFSAKQLSQPHSAMERKCVFCEARTKFLKIALVDSAPKHSCSSFHLYCITTPVWIWYSSPELSEHGDACLRSVASLCVRHRPALRREHVAVSCWNFNAVQGSKQNGLIFMFAKRTRRASPPAVHPKRRHSTVYSCPVKRGPQLPSDIILVQCLLVFVSQKFVILRYRLSSHTCS